jgi:hypothetical protein
MGKRLIVTVDLTTDALTDEVWGDEEAAAVVRQAAHRLTTLHMTRGGWLLDDPFTLRDSDGFAVGEVRVIEFVEEVAA